MPILRYKLVLLSRRLATVQVEVCADRLYGHRPRKGKEHKIELRMTERVRMLELEELLRELRLQCAEDKGF